MTETTAGPAAGTAATGTTATGTTTLAILLFDGVEELDAVGPFEVLASWALGHPDAARVLTASPDGRPVTGAKGMVLTPDCASADLPELDVFLHPGGRGTRPLMHDPAHLDRIRSLRARTPLMTSVCTGSLVYAAAGLLAGRPATTHWSAFDELLVADPSVLTRPDDRYVDDGDVVTSAGVSAGIDMALHLVRRLAGADTARATRRAIQYDPEPPV